MKRGTAHFKKDLLACGRREGGTVEGWINRFAPEWEERWYLLFSMIDGASHRSPGRAPNDLTGVFAKMM